MLEYLGKAVITRASGSSSEDALNAPKGRWRV
jgi:hypothetical protein